MSDTSLLYKITILHMLNRVDFPLSNTQITDFFLENQYTDYFTVQQSINGLEENDMISAIHSHANTQYAITSYGVDTLELFKDNLTEGIKADIKKYFDTNKVKMKQTNSISADYFSTSSGGYDVNFKLSEDNKKLIDIMIHVDTEAQAKVMCTNWKTRWEEMYISCVDILTK